MPTLTPPGVYAALTANTGIFAKEAVLADPDSGLRQTAIVKDVENCAVHEVGSRADADATGEGVQIHLAVEIDILAQGDVGG